MWMNLYIIYLNHAQELNRKQKNVLCGHQTLPFSDLQTSFFHRVLVHKASLINLFCAAEVLKG